MSMKIFYALIMSILFVWSPVFAQDQPPGDDHQPPSADDIVSKMQSKLNLTQDQVTAITPIIEKYASKRAELRQSMEDGTAEEDSIRSQMKELKADEKQELSQFLSEDQLGQWEQMQNQARRRRSNGEGNGESNSEATVNSTGPTGSAE